VEEKEATVQYFIQYAIKAESHLQWLIYHTEQKFRGVASGDISVYIPPKSGQLIFMG